MAARDDTLSFIKIRRRCEATVHELISRTEAIVLFGCPEATMRAISCSRGLSSESGLGFPPAQGQQPDAIDLSIEQNRHVTAQIVTRFPALGRNS